MIETKNITFFAMFDTYGKRRSNDDLQRYKNNDFVIYVHLLAAAQSMNIGK